MSSKCPGNTSWSINISVHLSLAVFTHRTLNGYPGLITHRRLLLENPVGTEVRQKPGPLQTIFELPPDEVYLMSHLVQVGYIPIYHALQDIWARNGKNVLSSVCRTQVLVL